MQDQGWYVLVRFDWILVLYNCLIPAAGKEGGAPEPPQKTQKYYFRTTTSGTSKVWTISMHDHIKVDRPGRELSGSTQLGYTVSMLDTAFLPPVLEWLWL